MICSPEELEEKFRDGYTIGKSCEIGIYAFSEWLNGEPVEESVILDKVVFKGDLETLEALGELKAKEGKESVLIFDGEHNYLFLQEDVESRDELEKISFRGTVTVKNLMTRYVVPGYINFKTDKESKVIKRWKNGKEANSLDF